MVRYLKSIYKSQQFYINWLSVFFNPFYFVRKGLLKGITQYAHIPEGKMLDLGCGRKPYKRSFTSVAEYIGLDVQGHGHDHSNEDIDVYYDGENIPFGDNTFDAVFSSEVFEHVQKLEKVIGEVHRVMKPGATLLITVPFVWFEHEMPYDFRRFSVNGISELLKTQRFEISETYKTTRDFETIFQLINMQIYGYLDVRYKWVRVVFNPILIFPFTLLGIIISLIVPNTGRFYCNTVILAKRQ